MGATVFIEKDKSDVFDLTNGTGADLEQNEFFVGFGRSFKAKDAIADGDSGAVEDLEGKVIQIDELTAGEDTFDAAEAAVYWDPTAKTFSDTSTATYFQIGHVVSAKDSGGVVRVLVCDPVLIPA